MISSPVRASGYPVRSPVTWRRGRFAFLAAPLAIVLLATAVMGAVLETAAEQDATLAPSPRSHGISSIFTPEIQLWKGALLDWSQEANVDPNLTAAVMQIESCGNPFARSTAGALGLFQVMPFHFAQTEDPFAPSVNARRGLQYLKQSLAASDGDPRLALAGYNGGIGVILDFEWNWPAETRRYASWADGIYTDAIIGASSSKSLADWLAAGGASLCRSAREVLSST